MRCLGEDQVRSNGSPWPGVTSNIGGEEFRIGYFLE